MLLIVLTFAMLRIVFILALFPAYLAAAENLTPCKIPNVREPTLCGRLDVFENRKAKTRRTIPLNLVVLPAFEKDKLPDPIFVLQGGPGQAATKLADFYDDIFGELRKTRDIVLVDQRGTGKSNSLQCSIESTAPVEEFLPQEAIKKCKAELGKKADITQYTTTIAMQDQDEVRQRLGYEHINIYGTSYGTWAAFVYLRQFPDRVRTLVLKGVVPPTMQLSVTTAFDAELAIDALITDCAADVECGKAFPNLRQNYEGLLGKLRKAPIPIKVSDTQTAAFTRAAFALTLRALLHAPASSTQIPLMIHQAAEGNLIPLFQTYTKLRDAYRQEFSLGMFLTIYCSEEIPRIDVANLPKDLDSTFHGDTWVSQFFRICPDWPKGEILADFHKPIQSDKPVLLISGGLDPVTPDRWAGEAAKTLPNSLNLVVPKAGHSFNLMKGCVDPIITEFVQKGSGKGIDTSCVNKIKRPPFAVN